MSTESAKRAALRRRARAELTDFRDNFENYVDLLLAGRTDVIDDVRAYLQQAEPKATSLLVDMLGDQPTQIDGEMTTTTSSLLADVLLVQYVAYDRNGFKPFARTAVAVLNKGIGMAKGDLWPRPANKPLLALRDQELQRRCNGVLASGKGLDTAIRESTIALESRLRGMLPPEILSQLIPHSRDQTGEKLANELLHPEHTIISVGSKRADRIAFQKMMIGIFAYWRNPTAHELIDDVDPSVAWSVVGQVDHLMGRLSFARIETEDQIHEILRQRAMRKNPPP